MDAVLGQMLILLGRTYGSYSFFLSLMWYITWIHLQILNHKYHLIMANGSFDVLFDLICWYLVENFCIHVHRRYWSVILFIGVFLILNKGNTGLIEKKKELQQSIDSMPLGSPSSSISQRSRGPGHFHILRLQI